MALKKKATSGKKSAKPAAKKSTTLKINFEGVTVRKLVPEADYRIKPTEITREVSDAKKPYLAWVFDIVGGKYEGSQLYYNTSLQPQALWNLRGVLEALGIEVPDSEMEIDLKEIIDEAPECGCTVEHEVYESSKKARIVDIFDAENLEETEEGEGEAEEEEEGETEEVEVTREDILAMDEDELKEFNEANDLGVDLKKLPKLSAKRKAVADAAEAQGEEAEEEEGGEAEEGEEGEITEESINEMEKSELASFCEEHELEVDLTGTTARQRRLVVKAAKAEGLIESE